MKSTKLFIGVGAFTLALGSFFVTKAGNKKSVPSTGHFLTTGGTDIANNLSSYTSSFTTTSTGKHKVWIAKTAGAGSYTRLATLFTSASRTNPVYH